MFQEKDIEGYKSIKASPQLKDRIRQSVENQRRKVIKQSVALVSAAACFALVFFSGGFLQSSGTIVSVNDVLVSHQAVVLDQAREQGVAPASLARSVAPRIQIPLEIEVETEAHVSVSQGTLQKEVETESETTNITEMDITESQVVYWTVTNDATSPITCTITEGKKEYTYLIEFIKKDSVFTIKQAK